jgi:hypothetical protein
VKRRRLSIDELLEYHRRAGIRLEGLMAVYAELKTEHPAWPDPQIRRAAILRLIARTKAAGDKPPAAPSV